MNFEFGEVDSFVVEEAFAFQRIDKILALKYQDIRSRTYFQKLIEEGFIQVNGKKVKKQFKPDIGSEIEVQFIITKELDLTPEEIPLDILYEDDYLIAINKPAGLVVHPAPGNWSGTFVNALLYHCKVSNFENSNIRPGIVHRLDKETSGVLLAAKDLLTQQKLSTLFSERSIKKKYIAICCGNPQQGEVKTLLTRHPKDRKLMAVSEEKGREAITIYQTLKTDGKLSVVDISLVTGRTHQIRVHMKHLGTPVLGDSSYGNLQMNKKYGVKRQLLHAEYLSFLHPITHEKIELIAPIPKDIEKFYQLIGYEKN